MTTNTFLVRWGGGWTERTDAGSIADVGRIEALLGLGAINSLAEAQRVSDGQLAEFARARTQTDVAILPIGDSDTPYVGFNVGDVVTVEGGAPHRVLGITVTEDKDTGRAIFVPTLNDDIVLTPDERVFQALRKMVNGTLGGRSKVAQPVVPRFIPRGSSISTTGLVMNPSTHVETFSGASSTFGSDLNWQDSAPHLLTAGGVGGIAAGHSYFFEGRRTYSGSVVYPWADHPELWTPGSPFAYYVEFTVAAWPSSIGPTQSIAECDVMISSDAGNVVYFDNGGGSTRIEHPLGFSSTPVATPIVVGSVVRLELRADGSTDYSVDGVSLASQPAGTVSPDYSSGWSGAFFSNGSVSFQILPGSGAAWADCAVAIDNFTLGPL